MRSKVKKLVISLIVIASILLCAIVAQAAELQGVEIYPLNSLKAGTKGTGYTVIRGTQIETFDVEILELIPTVQRLTKVNEMLVREIQLLQMSSNIQRQVQEEVGKNQREYFLREQMKAIQRELGEGDPKEQEQTEYDEKITKAQMPEEVEKKAREELQRLERMHPDSAEAGVIRTYIDTLCSMPWALETEDSLDIDESRRILDETTTPRRGQAAPARIPRRPQTQEEVKGPILSSSARRRRQDVESGAAWRGAMGRKFVRMRPRRRARRSGRSVATAAHMSARCPAASCRACASRRPGTG